MRCSHPPPPPSTIAFDLSSCFDFNLVFRHKKRATTDQAPFYLHACYLICSAIIQSLGPPFTRPVPYLFGAGPLHQLRAVTFLPGPPTPAPPGPTTPPPQAASTPQSPRYCDMRSLRAQLRPTRPAPMTPPLFCGTAATCDPPTAWSNGGKITVHSNNQSEHERVLSDVDREWGARPEGKPPLPRFPGFFVQIEEGPQ